MLPRERGLSVNILLINAPGGIIIKRRQISMSYRQKRNRSYNDNKAKDNDKRESSSTQTISGNIVWLWTQNGNCCQMPRDCAFSLYNNAKYR